MEFKAELNCEVEGKVKTFRAQGKGVVGEDGKEEEEEKMKFQAFLNVSPGGGEGGG